MLGQGGGGGYQDMKGGGGEITKISYHIKNITKNSIKINSLIHHLHAKCCEYLDAQGWDKVGTPVSFLTSLL